MTKKLNTPKSSTILSKADKVSAVFQYHQRTKHRFEAYARGPETLDWDDQPNPFRQFSDTAKIPLSIDIKSSIPNFLTVFQSLFSALSDEVNVPVTPITLNSISDFLRMSLGLSGWKQYGPDKWSLRVNPSSGNLHPTETYCIIPKKLKVCTDDGTLISGVHHYDVFNHQLEFRRDSELETDGGFYCALSSVIGRETWKYGERAFRYAQLDCGHALGCVLFSAKSLGWDVAVVDGITDSDLSQFLGLSDNTYLQALRKEDTEYPDTLLYVSPHNVAKVTDTVQEKKDSSLSALVECLQHEPVTFYGVPNALGGRSPYRWSIINEIATITDIDLSNPDVNGVSLTPLSPSTHNYDGNITTLKNISVVDNDIYHSVMNRSFFDAAVKRRSAQRFANKSIDLNQFKAMPSSLLITNQSLFSENRRQKNENFVSPIDFILLVHNVQDLEPGIYILPSMGLKFETLKSRLSKQSVWTPIKDCIFQHTHSNEVTQLYRLQAGDFSHLAARLCCQQAIASDCAFTLGYLAEFQLLISNQGAKAYKKLFWQAGMLAQQAYMMATGLGLAATGIGCYFDDPWHEFLGITDSEVQCVYQMAVGYPIVDERISRFSGYHHLKNA